MAKDKLTEYSATNASNDVIGDISVAEGMLPSAVNNALREQMTHLKNFSDGTDAIDALAVDNLKLDGNTISSTDTNGNITLDPNGTGSVAITGATVTSSGGSASAPAYAVTSGALGANGLFVPAANTLGFSAAGTERMRIDSSGNVGIGTSSPSSYDSRGNNLVVGDSGDAGITIFSGSTSDGRLVFASSGDASLSNGVIGYDQNADVMNFEIGGTERMSIDASGYLAVPQAYAGATGSAANVHILSSGVFLRSVSSGKYKTSIEDVQVPYAEELYNLRPVYYKSLGTFDNPDHSHWGFIAEEVAEIDPRLCFYKTTESSYDNDGNVVETTLDEPIVEGVQYDRMVPLLLTLLKEQRNTIQELEARITALETE